MPNSPQVFAGFIAFLAGAMLAPPAILSNYLHWSGNPHYSPDSDIVGIGVLAVAVIVGTASVHFLARFFNWYGGKFWKAALILTAYICLEVPFLVVYAFGYVCGEFGSCL